MNQADILEIFKKTNALLEGHFRLTSGLHSEFYFQCAKVLQYPHYTEQLCALIANHFSKEKIDVVIAPAIGGIIVGQEVARQLKVRSMFTERVDGIMQLRRGFTVSESERVLICEDVITTGGSVSEIINLVELNKGLTVGVGAIVDRSGGKVPLKNLYATVSLEIKTYQPSDCILCKKMIPIEKPGSREINK